MAGLGGLARESPRRRYRFGRNSCWAGAPPLGVLRETNPAVEQIEDTRVDKPVIDARALAAGAENAAVRKTLKLIGDRLWLHSHGIAEGGDGHLAGPGERVQQAQP